MCCMCVHACVCVGMCVHIRVLVCECVCWKQTRLKHGTDWKTESLTVRVHNKSEGYYELLLTGLT